MLVAPSDRPSVLVTRILDAGTDLLLVMSLLVFLVQQLNGATGRAVREHPD